MESASYRIQRLISRTRQPSCCLPTYLLCFHTTSFVLNCVDLRFPLLFHFTATIRFSLFPSFRGSHRLHIKRQSCTMLVQ